MSSAYDPLDVSQYTLDELKAAVEAARSWNTYVAAHANTDASIRMAIEAGARSIEHGFLLQEETLKRMAEKDVWLSIQPLLNDEDAFKFTGENLRKWVEVTDGTDKVYRLAKLKHWYTPYEALKIATSTNAELLALCGPRNPYRDGPLGVIKEGAYADLILVNGNPLENLDLVADPARNFVVIIKDGNIYKNTL